MQCLSLVFDAVPTDAKDTPDLMEIFNQACNDKGLELPKTSEPSADDKKAAEDFKKAGNVAMKEQKYQEAVDEYWLRGLEVGVDGILRHLKFKKSHLLPTLFSIPKPSKKITLLKHTFAIELRLTPT